MEKVQGGYWWLAFPQQSCIKHKGESFYWIIKAWQSLWLAGGHDCSAILNSLFFKGLLKYLCLNQDKAWSDLKFQNSFLKCSCSHCNTSNISNSERKIYTLELTFLQCIWIWIFWRNRKFGNFNKLRLRWHNSWDMEEKSHVWRDLLKIKWSKIKQKNEDQHGLSTNHNVCSAFSRWKSSNPCTEFKASEVLESTLMHPSVPVSILNPLWKVCIISGSSWQFTMINI